MSSISQNLMSVEKKEQISLSQKLTIHEQHHQLYALKWSEFQSSIVNCFQRLRDEEDFVDVTISCDQRSFAAHRVVLSACSPYFRKLLKSNPCKHPIIILRDVHSEHMECLLSFMYNGEVNVRQDQLQDFLKTAHLLQIRGLTDVSDNYCSPEFSFSENKPLDNSIISNKTYKTDSDKGDCNVECLEKTSGFSKYKLFPDRPITSALMTSFNNNSITPSLITETQSAASCLQRENTDPYRNRKNVLTPPPQKRIKSADLFRAQHGINSERALSEAEFPAILQHQISRERRYGDCDRAIVANETNTGSSIEEKTALNFQRTDIQSTHDESADDDSNCSSECPLDRVGIHQEANDSVDTRSTMPNMFTGIPKSLEQQGLLNKNDFEYPGEISSNLREKGFSTIFCNRFWNTKYEDKKEIGSKSAALSLMVKTACINKQPRYFQEMIIKDDIQSNNITGIQQQKQQQFKILQQFEIQQPLYDYIYELQKSTINQQKTCDTNFMEKTPDIGEDTSLRQLTLTSSNASDIYDCARTNSGHVLPCPLCETPLEQRYFRQHLDGHYPRDSPICPVIDCGRRFAHPNSVRNHMRIKHTHQWAKMKVMRSSAGHMPSGLDLNKKSMGISQEHTTAATLHAAKIVQLNALGHNFESLSPALTQSHCDLPKESITNKSFNNKRRTTTRFPTEPILRQHLSSDASSSENIKTCSSLMTKEPHLSNFPPCLSENQPKEGGHNLDDKKFIDTENSEHEEKNNFNEKESL